MSKSSLILHPHVLSFGDISMAAVAPQLMPWQIARVEGVLEQWPFSDDGAALSQALVEFAGTVALSFEDRTTLMAAVRDGLMVNAVRFYHEGWQFGVLRAELPIPVREAVAQHMAATRAETGVQLAAAVADDTWAAAALQPAQIVVDEEWGDAWSGGAWNVYLEALEVRFGHAVPGPVDVLDTAVCGSALAIRDRFFQAGCRDAETEAR